MQTVVSNNYNVITQVRVERMKLAKSQALDYKRLKGSSRVNGMNFFPYKQVLTAKAISDLLVFLSPVFMALSTL